MPRALVDESATTLYYEDSGAPSDSSNYTTMIMVHGMIFYSPVFHRLLPYAHKYNFRLVCLNMRDYPGSSPFSHEELSTFSTSPREAIRELGHQFAAFIAYFIRRYKVPEIKLNQGRRVAGIVFLTWSFSNIFHLALLAHAHTLPKETKTLLEKYWRRSVLYDPSLGNIGAAVPTGVYSPLRDSSLCLQARAEKFSTWVSAYYPPVPASAIATYTSDELLARQTLADNPQFTDNLSMDYMKLPTVERMSLEDFHGMTDFGVMSRSTEAMRAIPRDVYERNAKKALWDPEIDPDQDTERITFPHLSVLVLWFDMSIGDCIWATKLLAEQYELYASTKPSKARHVDFVCLQGMNHLAHWEQPEEIMQALAKHA